MLWVKCGCSLSLTSRDGRILLMLLTGAALRSLFNTPWFLVWNLLLLKEYPFSFIAAIATNKATASNDSMNTWCLCMVYNINIRSRPSDESMQTGCGNVVRESEFMYLNRRVMCKIAVFAQLPIMTYMSEKFLRHHKGGKDGRHAFSRRSRFSIFAFHLRDCKVGSRGANIYIFGAWNAKPFATTSYRYTNTKWDNVRERECNDYRRKV